MPHKSRWSIDVPNLSVPSFVFDSSNIECDQAAKIFISATSPSTHYLTVALYREWSKRFAAGLQKNGLQPGDRVLLFSKNSLFTPVIVMGVLMAGGIFVSANPFFTSHELAYQLEDCIPRFIFSAREQMEVAMKGVERAGLARSAIFEFHSLPAQSLDGAEAERFATPGQDLAQSWVHLLASANASKDFKWNSLGTRELCNQTALLFYSSGTTGLPKGVEVSHYNLVANMIQLSHMHGLNKSSSSSSPAIDEQRALCALPMYHGLGLVYYGLITPKARLPVYIMERFNLADFLECIEKFAITNLLLVPPIAVAMGKSPLVRKHNLSSVKRVVAGAAPLGMEPTISFEKLWPPGKIKIRQAWGMSEVPCMLFGWQDGDKTAETSISVGELVPGAEAKIVSVNDDEINDGEHGELWCRAPNVMKGYWHRPQATSHTITQDGWIKTGDIAYVDENERFYIVDRKKELIKVKGAQVAPAELEALLLEHPLVADVAVVGAKTEDGDERPRAYIVCYKNKLLTEQDVMDFVNARVSKIKRLTGGVCFISEIPKNPSGKILRRLLRERLDQSQRQSRL